MLNGEVFSLFDISEFRLCRKLVLICSAVLIQHRLMTDGQTDRQTPRHSIYRAMLMAYESFGNNWMTGFL